MKNQRHEKLCHIQLLISSVVCWILVVGKTNSLDSHSA